MKTSPQTFSDPHYNVTLVTSVDGLPVGQFEVVGYFHPEGFLGPREARYRYRITGRKNYDATARRIRRRYGNTVAGAEALFDRLKPTDQLPARQFDLGIPAAR